MAAPLFILLRDNCQPDTFSSAPSAAQVQKRGWPRFIGVQSVYPAQSWASRVDISRLSSYVPLIKGACFTLPAILSRERFAVIGEPSTRVQVNPQTGARLAASSKRANESRARRLIKRVGLFHCTFLFSLSIPWGGDAFVLLNVDS